VVNLSVPGGGAVAVPDGDDAVGCLLDGWLVEQAPSTATGATSTALTTVTGLRMAPAYPKKRSSNGLSATSSGRRNPPWLTVTSVRMTSAPIQDIPLTTLDGNPMTLSQFADRALLVVNVASKCGLTPQYSALQRLAGDYADRGLTVIGVPCNQFMGQEPGSAEEIKTFCSATYGVTFPLLEKSDVNGEGCHPLREIPCRPGRTDR
jgi:hypothetical protein